MTEVEPESLNKVAIYSIFSSFLVFLIGTTLAMLFYDDYNFLNQYFSELGVRQDTISPKGKFFAAAKFPEIFNLTLIFSGILIIPFFTSLESSMNASISKLISNRFFRICGKAGVLSGILLIGVGIFDLYLSWGAHVWFATSFYVMITLTTGAWGVGLFYLPENHKFKLKKWIYFDYFAIAIFLVICLFNIFKIAPMFFPFTIQSYQKMLAYVFIFYFVTVANRF